MEETGRVPGRDEPAAPDRGEENHLDLTPPPEDSPNVMIRLGRSS